MEELTFESMNLSPLLLKGLKENNYMYPTKIQRLGIQSALEGYDIAAAAKTGSGKTLAFLIPVLEILSKSNWQNDQGVGCLIISPTRELSYQTFEVLKKIGKHFDFSVGIIFGGKKLQEEAKYIQNINILIATPGRLLQHMDQTQLFDCFNLKILVIDEGDKIMEADFYPTLKEILKNLPTEGRQTLLYSATMNRSINDLAQLSLKNPFFINTYEDLKAVTPKKLQQFYTICELDQKMNFLFTFIKTHLKNKIIVFFSSCKQVRYYFQFFCSLTPGTVVLALYGSQKQNIRLENFDKFNKKLSSVLFTTDLSSRGLDFPQVDWVIQLDCPDNPETYVHRVGRTARFNKNGSSLLVLLPTQKKFIKSLSEYNVPIEEIFFKDQKITDLSSKAASYCARDPENKKFAEACFFCSLKSIYVQKKRKMSKISKLPLNLYAKSLGLLNIPELNFSKKKIIEEENCDDEFLKPTTNPTQIPEKKKEKIKKAKTKLDKKPKIKPVTKAYLAKKALRLGLVKNTKIKFNEND